MEPGSYNNIASGGRYFGFWDYRGHGFLALSQFCRFYANEIQIGRFKTKRLPVNAAAHNCVSGNCHPRALKHNKVKHATLLQEAVARRIPPAQGAWDCRRGEMRCLKSGLYGQARRSSKPICSNETLRRRLHGWTKFSQRMHVPVS